MSDDPNLGGCPRCAEFTLCKECQEKAEAARPSSATQLRYEYCPHCRGSFSFQHPDGSSNCPWCKKFIENCWAAPANLADQNTLLKRYQGALQNLADDDSQLCIGKGCAEYARAALAIQAEHNHLFVDGKDCACGYERAKFMAAVESSKAAEHAHSMDCIGSDKDGAFERVCGKEDTKSDRQPTEPDYCQSSRCKALEGMIERRNVWNENLEAHVEKLKALILLVDPAVSSEEMNSLSAKQFGEYEQWRKQRESGLCEHGRVPDFCDKPVCVSTQSRNEHQGRAGDSLVKPASGAGGPAQPASDGGSTDTGSVLKVSPPQGDAGGGGGQSTAPAVFSDVPADQRCEWCTCEPCWDRRQPRETATTADEPTGEQLMVLQKAAVAYCREHDDYFDSDGVPTDDVFKDGALWAWRHPLPARPAKQEPDMDRARLYIAKLHYPRDSIGEHYCLLSYRRGWEDREAFSNQHDDAAKEKP